MGQTKIGKRLPRRQPKLKCHQIKAGDRLGDRMFHLDARVGFDEIKRAASLDQKFHRAQPAIVAGPSDGDRRAQHPVAGGVGQVRRGGQFDHLLVPPLHRAVAFPQVGHVLPVTDDLHLDVAHRLQEPFGIKLVVAKGGQCLGPRLCKCRVDVARVPHDAHPAPAAAVHRLDHQRRTALRVKKRVQLRRRRQRVRPVQHRHACILGQRTGRHLVPLPPQRRAIGTDKDQTGRRTGIGKICPLA